MHRNNLLGAYLRACRERVSSGMEQGRDPHPSAHGPDALRLMVCDVRPGSDDLEELARLRDRQRR
ncbi:hypothetical protein [Streptomyces malaysiensis]|uniref:hypothetical protein n=1 Tax=Streptomyces malaysiensis TaxID=92644 RepID=UPI00367C42E6